MESRGLIRRLHFGDLVLLQPELLDAYASRWSRRLRRNRTASGSLPRKTPSKGGSGWRRGAGQRQAQEKLLLIATVEELLRHEIALKDTTDRGVDLVFPSQFTRERPDAPDIPGKQVTFAFEGPLHNIYATPGRAAVAFHLFRRQAMWQNAASYTATVGGVCGIHLRELEEGRGELALFYDGQAGPGGARPVRDLRRRAPAAPGPARNTRPPGDPGLPELRLRPARRPRSAQAQPGHRPRPVPGVRGKRHRPGDDQPSCTAEAAVAEMNRSADERRDRNVAEARLKGKIETGDYDVFLCHNSKDRDAGHGHRRAAQGTRHPALAGHLGDPPWHALAEGTAEAASGRSSRRRSSSAPEARGPWQELEVESLLAQLARRNKPDHPGHPGRP